MQPRVAVLLDAGPVVCTPAEGAVVARLGGEAMSERLAFLRRHDLVAFFVLTFLLSWGGVAVVVGPGVVWGTPGRIDQLIVGAVLVMVAGPTAAALLLTVVLEGRSGLRVLSRRLWRWRLPIAASSAALFLAPCLMLGLLLLLAFALRAPAFMPRILTADAPASVLLLGLLFAVLAGVFEEIGWTGFALPRLRRRLGALASGVVLGVIWAGWHLLVAWWMWASVGGGALALVSCLLDPFLFLVGYRVFMVGLYDRTGSLSLAMLLHASLTASARLFSPDVLGAPLLLFDLLWASSIAVIVAVIGLRQRAGLAPGAQPATIEP